MTELKEYSALERLIKAIEELDDSEDIDTPEFIEYPLAQDALCRNIGCAF
jgi:hypothetical protein